MEVVFNEKEGYHEFVGSVDLWVDVSTYVDVDGQRYWNHKRDIKSFTAEELCEKHGFFIEEYEFDVIGYSFKIKLPKRNYEALMRAYSRCSYSTVESVNFIKCLFDNGMLSDKIEHVYSGREHLVNWKYIYENDMDIIRYNKHFKMLINDIHNLNFLCFNYGPYHGVYYNISSRTLVETDYKNLPEYLLKILIKLKIFTKKQDIEGNALRLLDYKLKNYYPESRYY